MPVASPRAGRFDGSAARAAAAVAGRSESAGLLLQTPVSGRSSWTSRAACPVAGERGDDGADLLVAGGHQERRRPAVGLHADRVVAGLGVGELVDAVRRARCRRSARSGRSAAPGRGWQPRIGSRSRRSSAAMEWSGRKPVAATIRSTVIDCSPPSACRTTTSTRSPVGVRAWTEKPVSSRDPAGVDVLAQPGAERAAGGQGVGVPAAVGAGRATRARIAQVTSVPGLGVGELGEGRAGCWRRSGRRRRRGCAGRRTGPGPRRARRAARARGTRRRRVSPRAGRPDAPRTFGVPQVPEASMTARARSLVAVGEADQERGGLAAGGAEPVQAEPADRLDPGAVAQVRLERGQLGQGLEVVGGELARRWAGRPASGATQPASSSSRRAAGSMLYRHGENSRTCPHCRTAAPAVSPASRTSERQAALVQVRGGGQADRAGADHHDGQVVQGLLIGQLLCLENCRIKMVDAVLAAGPGLVR